MENSAHDYLLSCGVRPSVQRVAIMDYLLKHPTHPTAEEIHWALSSTMPTLSRMTVYNSLNLFVACGAINAVDIDAGTRRFDGNANMHAHFMCRRCKIIVDVDIKDRDAVMQNIPEGVRADEVQFLYKGFCNKCLTNKNQQS